MRVISGKFKGKRLFSPVDNKVRPTTDRIKETLFNILYSTDAVYGQVLDLFSGSGALGIEALSRGAERVVFVDKDPVSIKLTYMNLNHVLAENYEVYNTDFQVALRKLNGRKFDIIFADPPYNAGLEAKILQGIRENDILSYGGIMVIEHSKENELQIRDKSFIIDKRICGNTALTFIINRGDSN